jgi:ribonuclease Z
MRITLLGTGTPVLDPQRKASATLIEIGTEKLLFDAGRGVTTQLAKIDLHPRQIDTIFITHHHYDHIGNLGELLLTCWHGRRETQVNVYGPQGTARIVAALFQEVYVRDIAFARFTQGHGVDITDIVQVHDIAPGLVCEGDDWRVLSEHVDHGHGLGLSREEWPCLGYRIEASGKVVAMSGDAVACEGLDRLAQGADVLLQCCYLAECEIQDSGFERLARHVIASSGQVGKIAKRNDVKTLVLTHIRPKSEAMMQSLLEDVRADFDGEIHLAKDLMALVI